MHYQIIEPGRFDPQDGETHGDIVALWNALKYSTHDAKVFAVDMAEAWRDGATSFRDVTEALVTEGVENDFIPRDSAIAEHWLGEAEQPTFAEMLAHDREMYA